jgi:hypothetical protein
MRASSRLCDRSSLQFSPKFSLLIWIKISKMNYQVWRPHPSVTSHAGLPLSIDADFFVSPPIEIGNIISANTTLTKTAQPMNLYLRSILIAAAGVVLQAVYENTEFSLLVGGLIGLIIWNITQFRKCCSYVGTRGLAEYYLVGSRLGRIRVKFLLFENVDDFYTKTVHNYTDSVYSMTRYKYRWVNRSGNSFVINGFYTRYFGPDPNYILGNQVEFSWNKYISERYSKKDLEDGYVEFPICNRGKLIAVRVGKGFLDFITIFEGIPHFDRITQKDLKEFQLKEGVFYFKHQNSRWWSRKGKYHCKYADISNAKVFTDYLARRVNIFVADEDVAEIWRTYSSSNST